MTRSMRSTTTAVTITARTGARRVRPNSRSCGVTLGSGMTVCILALDPLRHCRGDGRDAARGHVGHDVGQDTDEEGRRGEYADGEALAPDRAAESPPFLKKRSEKHRAQPPQDVARG